MSDVDQLVAFYQAYNEPPMHLNPTICPELEENFHHRKTPGHLCLHALHCTKQHHIHCMKALNALLEYGDLIIARLHAETTTEEEKGTTIPHLSQLAEAEQLKRLG